MKTIILICLITNTLLSSYSYGKIILVPYNYLTIQTGIDNASIGDTVLVSPGTYVENINFNGKNIVVASLYLTTGDTSFLSQTVINGNRSDFVVTFENGENSYSQIMGFTITDGGMDSVSLLGGGLICNNSSPVIKNNKIVFNSLGYAGMGAIYCINSNAFISRNIIKNNKVVTADHAGAIVCINSNPVISENLIENNSFNFVQYSAGIFCSNSRPLITNNKIISNTGGYVSKGGGGIICINESIADIKFNIIAKNDHDSWSAGVLVKNSQAYVVNNTIYENIYGIIALDTSYVSINSSIIWHTSSFNNSTYIEQGSYIWSKWTDVQDTLWVYSNCGNINIDPLFVDPSNNDFSLQPNSPCVDAGNPFQPKDPDGTWADMGAIYYEQATVLNEGPFIRPRNFSNVFPNPFSTYAIITFHNPQSETYQLVLYNSKGQEVKRIEGRKTEQIEIKRDGLPNGIYFYSLNSKQKTIGTGKVIVGHY